MKWMKTLGVYNKKSFYCNAYITCKKTKYVSVVSEIVAQNLS